MDREEIREALLKAYEAGWRGSRELKEEYAEEALNDLLGPEDEEKEKKEEQQMLSWTTPLTAGWSDQSGQSASWGPPISVSSEWVVDRSNWSTIELPELPEILELPELPELPEILELPETSDEEILEIVPEETPSSGAFEGDEL